ncbi:MAG: hypothetical protein IPM38_10550 [Ignavibacteria bacterium]|nr:hypothetical protein [Ignavibacteria bacterium]
MANLRKVIKEDNGIIVSARFSLYFPAADSETLTGNDKYNSGSFRTEIQFPKSPYYSDESWSVFESLKGDLLIGIQLA